jgi:hypothetical protein
MSALCGVPGLTASKTKTSAGPLLCRWTGCEAYENSTEFGSVEELARHVQTAHVEPLESQDVVVCQWEKCKVFNVPSLSIQWLKRHVQQVHTKDRPFKCIMNGCIMSFNTREALQRHVNRHLEPSVPPAASSSSSPTSLHPRQNSTKTARGGGKMQQGRQVHSSQFVHKTYSPLNHLYSNSPPRHHHQRFEIPTDSSYDSSEDNGRRRIGRKKPLSLKIRIPRRSISLSSLYPTPYNGAYIHADVWDRKMMSVVRQTCNKLMQDPNSSKGLCISLNAKVLGRRRSLLAEDELLVRWTPHL